MNLMKMLEILKSHDFDKRNVNEHRREISLRFKDEQDNYYELKGIDIDLYSGCHCKSGVIIIIGKENE